MDNKFTFSLHENGAQVLIEVTPQGGKPAGVILDAHDLDNVLSNLTRVRAAMTPGHPRTLDPKPIFRNTVINTVFSVFDHVEAPRTRDIVLAALHPGLGWVAFRMKPEHSMKLGTALLAAVGKAQASASLVKPDGSPI